MEDLIEEANAIVAFDTGAGVLFKQMSRRRHKCLKVLEASIAMPWFVNKQLARAARAYPDWAMWGDSASGTPRQERNALREAMMADIVSVGSDFAASTFLDAGVPPERVLVNPYGSQFDPVAGQDSRTRQGFLFCGGRSLRKGLPDVLRAHATLSEGAILHVVGESPPPAITTNCASGRIVFHGHVPAGALRKLMCSVRATIVPSYAEGLSQVILESLASGAGVIATAESGVETVVRAYPETRASVLVVPAGEPDALADALLRSSDLIVGKRCSSLEVGWSRYAERLVARIRDAC